MSQTYKVLAHRNLFVGAISVLKKSLLEGKQADKELEHLFKINKKWGKRDRAFVAETVYDCVRWRRRIEFQMSADFNAKNLWTGVGIWLKMKGGKLPEWAEFSRVKTYTLKPHYPSPAIKESIPDWLWTEGSEQLGKEPFLAEIETMNEPAKVVLRVNTRNTNRDALMEHLEKVDGMQSDGLEDMPDAIVLRGKPNVFRSEVFQKGHFEVQDANSQKIALFTDVKPGMRVIDACAGAGGKTLHMAELMDSKGQIIAMDIYDWKLKELKRRAKRNNLQNIQIRLITDNKVLKRLKQSADLVLIDSPCSGLGVLKRNPNAKWRLSLEIIRKIESEQREILATYAKLVKSGGSLVYATCSILPSENQDQVNHFLTEHTNFQLDEEQVLLPSQTGFDGFYMARMRKG